MAKQGFEETLEVLLAYSRGELYKLLGPRLVFVEPTSLCNLKCQMCDRWKWRIKDKLTTQNLLGIFEELRVLGTKRIVLTGGEPLLRKDIKELIEGINKAGIKPTLYTNGYLFNSEIALRLLENNADISFSLDGFRSSTHEKIRGVSGSFSPVIEGVRLLAQRRRDLGKNEETTRIVVNYTIQEDNVADLELGASKIDKLGADGIRFALVHSPGRLCLKKDSVQKVEKFVESLTKNQDRLKTSVSFSPFVLDLVKGKLDAADLKQGRLCGRLLEEFPVPCFISYYSMTIGPFGRVFPCLYAHYDTNDFASYEKRRQKFVVGDVFQESLRETWYGRKYNEFRGKVKLAAEKTIPGVCSQCEYYHQFKDCYLGILEARDFLKKTAKGLSFDY